MDYKKIIKNQEMRFKILNSLRYIPDIIMIDFQYRLKLKRRPAIKSPKRFTEKLQWYKLNYRDPLMSIGSDKYEVREYVNSKGLGETLTKLYGVFEKPEQIEFSKLPDKFVLKTTNGSGTNYFCRDKRKFPFKEIKHSLSFWLSRNIYASGREWSYKNIMPRIVVEELLEDKKNPFQGINDYKFMCFNGIPSYIVLDVDRHVKHKRNIYDINWNLLNVSTDHSNIDQNIEEPDGLAEMLEVAKKLSADFPFVRVDLYWVNEKVYFGELTFYPWTGYVQFTPDEFDFELGEQFKLPSIKNERSV